MEEKGAPQGDGDDWGAPPKGPPKDEGGWGKVAPQGDGDDGGAPPKGPPKDEEGWGKAPQGDGDDWGAPAKGPPKDEGGWGNVAPQGDGDDWGDSDNWGAPKRPGKDGGAWKKVGPQGDGDDCGAPRKRPAKDGGGWGKVAPQGDGDDWSAPPKRPAKDGGGWGKVAPQGDGDDWSAPPKGPPKDEEGWGKVAPQGDDDDWGAPPKGPPKDEEGWGKVAPQGDGDDWGATPQWPAKDGGGWAKVAPQGDGDDWGAPPKRAAEDWADGARAKRPRNEEGELERLPDYLELACPDDIITKQIRIPPGAAGAIIGKGGANIKALRASIPSLVQIKLEKGVNLVVVTSDSVAAVEKVESYIECVAARIHSKNFRPDVSISCFQVPDGACRLVLQLLPRDARARCLPEFLSPTKEVYFYHSCMPDCAVEKGGESPTSPLPTQQPIGKDANQTGCNGQESPRASSRVVCLDWLGAQAAELLPEFADILKAAASTYNRGTRLKVQAQIAKNFFRGAEEKVSISTSAKELEGMLAMGTLTLQSSSAYEEDSVTLARTFLGKLGFDKLPIDRKISVHFLNTETKLKHTLSLPDDFNGVGEKAVAVAREIERILKCTDYFQVFELPLDKPFCPETVTRTYRRITLLVRADEKSKDAIATVVNRVVNEAYCCLMEPEKLAHHKDSLPMEKPLCSNVGEEQQETQARFKKNYGRHAFFSFLREGSGGDFRVMVKTRPACPESAEPIPEEAATEMLEIVKEAVCQRSPEGLLKFGSEEKKHVVKVVRYKTVEVFYNEDHKVLLKKVEMQAVGGESLSRWEICLVSQSLKEELEGKIQTEAVAVHLGHLISLATRLTEAMGALVCLQEIQQSPEGAPSVSCSENACVNLPLVDEAAEVLS